jgi:hypothetical protein
MAISSEYEAACEVREAVREAAYDLDEALLEIRKAVAAGPPRRDRWAGELFTGLAMRALAEGVPITGKHAGTGQELAARAWELADALDAADPRRPNQPAAATGQGGAEDGSDLAAEDDQVAMYRPPESGV